MKASSIIFVFIILVSADKAIAACNVTTTDISFGAYDVVSPVPLDSTGSISITCDERPSARVTVSIGQSPNSGVFNPRQMNNISTLMNYNVYIDSARTIIWGDGTAGTSTQRVTVPSARSRRLTTYGRVPPLQDLSVGVYTDTLTVTIIW